MAKTVADILKESGLSDEQITAIDAKAMDGLTRVVTSANESLDKAELALRAQREEYDKNIAPALANWADRDTAVSTENAAMKAWIQKVKDSGYVPPELFSALPGMAPSSANPNPSPAGVRDAGGRFVAGANPVPGSPSFVDIEKKLNNDLAGFATFVADTTWKYESLYGQKMPDPPSALVREAAQNRMSPQEWVAKKYDFAGKERAAAEAKAKSHDDAIRKETEERVNKEWAERSGNNPMVRTPSESAFASVNKAVQSGQRKDPLKMTSEERKANTHSTIQREIQEHSSRVQ